MRMISSNSMVFFSLWLILLFDFAQRAEHLANADQRLGCLWYNTAEREINSKMTHEYKITDKREKQIELNWA